MAVAVEMVVFCLGESIVGEGMQLSLDDPLELLRTIAPTDARRCRHLLWRVDAR